jgi:hypothetical protein
MENSIRQALFTGAFFVAVMGSPVFVVLSILLFFKRFRRPLVWILWSCQAAITTVVGVLTFIAVWRMI